MSPKLRITFVLAHAGVGGGTRVVSMLAEGLSKRGHTVVVVSTPLPKARVRDHVRHWLGLGPRPLVEAVHSHFDGLGVDHRVLERWRPIRSGDVPDGDVIVATWWETAEWVGRMPEAKGAKAYFIQQYEANFGMSADRVDATWRLPMRKIVCSRWLADLARDRFGYAGAAVVPNGVDTSLFRSAPRGRQPVPTVGFYYSTHPVKGCAMTIGAIEAVRREFPNLRVLAYGADETNPTLPLPPGAEFSRQPPQSVIAEIYRRCDVWVCGSLSEGFHLSPHEAMACRCPVVSTRVGGPMDLIEDGVSGFLVEPGDGAGLRERLMCVLKMDDGAWRTLSEAAHASAVRFTWEDAAARFEAALLDCVRPARRVAGAGMIS